MIYLAKELHFPRALPPRNRREAQGCEIKITDELHHGVFFFLIFCDVRLLIYLDHHSKPSFRETMNFSMHSFFLICERVLRHLKKGLLRGVRTKERECARFERLKPELSAARESNECSVARSFES